MASTVEREIIDFLPLLPLSAQGKVLEYVKSLLAPKENPNAELLHFAGSFDKEWIAAVEKMIEAGCETVDMNELNICKAGSILRNICYSEMRYRHRS